MNRGDTLRPGGDCTPDCAEYGCQEWTHRKIDLDAAFVPKVFHVVRLANEQPMGTFRDLNLAGRVASRWGGRVVH